MRIATKNIIFVVLLLGATVTSLVVAMCVSFSFVITENKNERTSRKLDRIQGEFTSILDQYEKLAFLLKSDPHLDELLRAFKFTRHVDPIKEKLPSLRGVAGFDEISLYDAQGKLVYATPKVVSQNRPPLTQGLESDVVTSSC